MDKGPIENAYFFRNFPKEWDETTLVQCPKCNVVSKVIDWEDAYPVCEDCGDHAGLYCPNNKCNILDHVWDSELNFKVK